MKRLLLAAAGLMVLAGAASAQPDQNWQGHNRDQNNNRESHQSNRPQQRQAPQNDRAPQQNVQHYQPAPQGRGGAYNNEGAHPNWRGSGQNGAIERAQPNQYERYNHQAPMDRGGQGQYQYRNGGQYQYRNGAQYQYRNGGQYQYRNGGQYQYRNGGQYRGGQYQYRNGAQNFRNWSGSNFRLRGDWWREHSGFRGYYGRREGFWFAPGWGYYRVDPRWWDFDWAIGSVVPYELQSYYVSDYWDYGLPPPPYGCEYIFLGDQIVLIDRYSGEILEIVGAY